MNAPRPGRAGASDLSAHSRSLRWAEPELGDGWIEDDELTPDQRAWAREYVCPRIGFDGRVLWAADELGGAPWRA